MSDELVGTVKWFDDKKGFGFITDALGRDYFVHFEQIVSKEKRRTLRDGERVRFGFERKEKGLMATKVRKESDVSNN